LAAACDQALLYADRERVQQVLFNLLGNAIKFTPPDGVVGVEVVLHAPAAEIRIAVTDNGPGIPPDELPRIFERYWQGQPGRRGSGLGLYIAQGIVAAHGGRIWADSRLGEGSTFSFALPIAAEEIPLESEPAGSRTTWSGERTPTPRRPDPRSLPRPLPLEEVDGEGGGPGELLGAAAVPGQRVEVLAEAGAFDELEGATGEAVGGGGLAGAGQAVDQHPVDVDPGRPA